MATYRAIKESGNFVTVNKNFIHDNNLSFKAKGILLYLLSRPDDWQIYETEILKHTLDGKDSLKSGIKELEEVGYVVRTRKRNDKGHLTGYEYLVYEQSNHNGISYLGLSDDGKTDNGKSAPTNNNSTNNDLTKNDSRVDFIPYKEIIDYLNSKTGKRYSHKSKANQKLIKARMNEGYTKDDFIRVIDTKTNEWINIEDMKSYLQPTTLFGNKFDKYLNQEMKQETNNNSFFDKLMNEEG
ncbi:conserved phage C-terminal domain-containing protein [Staphylococcus gallinarum]|uniref:conserved phage C-terminal domain-containing protein n=1 Tax=Staphylococcus gallinarum TaxID=1293 RepID=UPI001E31C990|nr:conserved phage C-terminal domain-containing protein [Staphylococcus gallinarum]MCD8821218.1 conserved phage C-terminal domain-containing protein [Staphylococcus gallinarum]